MKINQWFQYYTVSEKDCTLFLFFFLGAQCVESGYVFCQYLPEDGLKSPKHVAGLVSNFYAVIRTNTVKKCVTSIKLEIKLMS